MSSQILIPGVEPYDLNKIKNKIGFNDLKDLEVLAKRGKIRKINGLNSKTEMAILRGIKILKERPESLPIGIALDIAQKIINYIVTWPNARQVLIVGDLRRGVEEVNKIEILIEGKKKEFKSVLKELPGIDKLVSSKNETLIFKTKIGLPLYIHFSLKEEWGTKKIFTTGSKVHIEVLKEISDGKIPVCDKEIDVYKNLGLVWITPEIRETGYEIKFAQENMLPQLLNVNDIKGDLHLHSRWSDGSNSIEELVQKGIKLGYEYIAITDHSQSLKIAGGLNPKDLEQQIKEIAMLNKKYHEIKILKGIEVDILEDGSLDFSDDVLYKLDLVINLF